MAILGVLYKTCSAYSISAQVKGENGHYDELMVAETRKYRVMPVSLFEKLSTELLVLIFTRLRDIDTLALAGARQLSIRLETVVTPIYFECICLNERLISPETETYFPRIIHSLCSFARHVEVRSDLDPVATRKLLNRLRRLSSLRWRYVSVHHSGYFSTPSGILGLNRFSKSSIRLYVEGISLHSLGGNLHDIDLQEMLPDNLVSLKTVTPVPSLIARFESLKRLLIEARSIEIFHHDDRGQGTQFSFKQDERLPAFRELSLRSYDWNHSIGEVEKHWDFSQLRRLALVDVPLLPFLSSVPPSQLRQLHALQCEDFSTHLQDQRKDATRGLYKLITQIRSLHTLRVTCHTNLFPVSGLLSHANSLRILSFRDYVGFGDESRRCPTMRVEDLYLLSHRLFRVHTIELDMDATLCEPALFLRTLCNFSELDTLVLHTQTILRASEVLQRGTDPDFDTAMSLFSILTRCKQGKPWRSITINVGGWKHVMIRRVGEAWRQQNKNGFFAERCFVLERDADTGGTAVRENVGVDNTSVCMR